ncbi:hypothetical protein [Enterococcus sp. AZ194]|uniref:hypothetical protein n=1 Tax=Enterococcus sp. AZ194 TaxID=2774629 RepID=UPI003F686FC4
MTIFGLSVGEVATLFGLGSSLLALLMYLFKKLVIADLDQSIRDLNRSLDSFTNQMAESQRDRVAIHNEIDELRLEITKLSTSHEERFVNIFKRLDRLEEKL